MMIDRIAEAPFAGTFGDLIILPGLSRIEPAEIDVSSALTSEITLSAPLVSSPMDTVTESEMAIALAREGGIGILHRNCSIEEEVDEAKRVKRAEAFIIRDVITVTPEQTVGEAARVMREKSISGLPVVRGDRLVGIITRRDVSFSSHQKEVGEVMTTDLVTAKEDITTEEAQQLMAEHKVEKLPIVDDMEKLEGLITVKDIFLKEEFPHAVRDEEGRLRVGAAISPFDLERAKALDGIVDLLVTDVAHFHNQNVINATKKLEKDTATPLVVGNVGTREAALDIASQLDRVVAVRAGVGSGSSCTTSEVTRSGSPTAYATAACFDAFSEVGADITIIADGGITGPGHAALAFAVGASTVMMGNFFARCRESPGELVTIGSRYYKRFRGMGSAAARAKRFALDRYSKPSKEIEEGVEGLVPYSGNASDAVSRFLGGLQAAMGYAGCSSLRELRDSARLARVSPTGVQELSPHGIVLPSGEMGLERG